MSSQRNSILGSIALAVVLTATACASDSNPGADTNTGAAKTDNLVISTWGGTFTETTKKYLADPFGEENGVTIQMVDAPGEHIAQVEAQVKANNVTWDVIDSLDGPAVAVMAQRGLLEPLPADLKAAMEEVSAEGMVTDYGIMQSSIANILACDPARAKICPTSLAEFFDTDAFPGPRMMYNAPLDSLYTAWASSGEIPEDPTPADVDRAFALLEKIKPSVQVWWDSGDQSQQAIRSGEVDMGILWNGRVKGLVDEGTKLDIIWDGAFYSPAYTVVVKGAPNMQNAFGYLKSYATNAQAQADWVKVLAYGVSNPKAIELLPADVSEYLPESHLSDLVFPNIEWWMANNETVNKRWQEFIGS